MLEMYVFYFRNALSSEAKLKDLFIFIDCNETKIVIRKININLYVNWDVKHRLSAVCIPLFYQQRDM